MVTCPGVILRDRGDVFLRVVLLGSQRNSLCLPPVFPLLFHQSFPFKRAFPGCSRLVDLEQLLEEEPVLVELIQLDEENLSEGAKVIAFYHSSVKEFLFPEDRLIPTYADSEQEVLMQRSFWFARANQQLQYHLQIPFDSPDYKGISPKLEFSSKTTIKDTSTPYLGGSYYGVATDNGINSKSVSFNSSNGSGNRKDRRRTRSYDQSSSVMTSPTGRRVPRLKTSITEDRAPFIVKRGDSFNRAVSPSRVRSSISPRRPASAPPKPSLSLKRKSLLPTKEKPQSCYISEEDCKICQVYYRYVGRRYWGHKKYYHPSEETPLKRFHVVRESEDEYGSFPHPESSSHVDYRTEDVINRMNGLKFDEDPSPGPDVEYGRLPYSPRVSRVRSRSPIRFRARSASPRGRARSPDISGLIGKRVQRALDYDYSTTDQSDVSSVTSQEALGSLRRSMSPRRRRRVSFHIDEGRYWSSDLGQYNDSMPRGRFNDTLSEIYKRLRRDVKDAD